MYRVKKFKNNGFKSQAEFRDTILWLRVDMGCSLQSIADLYDITKQYVEKLTEGKKPPAIKNRKPKGVATRPETGA